jgi:hypothetical protein
MAAVVVVVMMMMMMMMMIRNRDNSVGIAMGYMLDGRDSTPGGGKKYYSSLLQLPDRLWGPPSFLASGYWGIFP